MIFPKVGPSMFAFGLANSGLLKTLNASARSVNRMRSVMGKLLNKDMSVLNKWGPRRMLRPIETSHRTPFEVTSAPTWRSGYSKTAPKRSFFLFAGHTGARADFQRSDESAARGGLDLQILGERPDNKG